MSDEIIRRSMSVKVVPDIELLFADIADAGLHEATVRELRGKHIKALEVVSIDRSDVPEDLVVDGLRGMLASDVLDEVDVVRSEERLGPIDPLMAALDEAAPDA